MSIDAIPEAPVSTESKTKSIDEIAAKLQDFSLKDSSVRPSQPVVANTIKLSVLDAYAPKVWVPQTHFWRVSHSDSIEKTYHVLAQGLSRTLSEIPALAGKLERTSNDPRDVIIRIDSSASVDLGYQDLSSHVDVPCYDEIEATGFPISDLIAPLCAQESLGTVFEGASISAFKLNKLKGGIALSCAFNHVFSDATTVAQVQKMWALHTADVFAGVAERVHLSKVDDIACRERLNSPRDGASDQFSAAHYKLFPADASSLALPKKQEKTEVAMKLIAEAQSTSDSAEIPKWCMWKFTPESLAKLKTDCSAGLNSGEWISTINALIGLFWSRVLLKKQDPPAEQSTSTLLFPINIRSRLGIDPMYLGNVVDIVSAATSIDELKSSSGWAAAARSIRKGIDDWSVEDWDSWLATAKKLSADEALCPNPLILLNQHNMIFNDYSKSEACLLDWGAGIGRPDATRYMRPAGMMKGCATAIIVYPRLADGSLEVAMATTDDIREALVNDVVFSQYTTLTACFA